MIYVTLPSLLLHRKWKWMNPSTYKHPKLSLIHIYFHFPRKIAAPATETSVSTLEEMELQMIQKAIEKCNGNLSAVAAQLGITRQTLYNKMKKFGL